MLALGSGGGPAAASAAYTAYSHQITITDNGGECTSVGKWDQYHQSCTLNTDISDTTVWINGSGVTLNGNSHLLSGGADAHYGVILGDNTSGITVKSLTVNNFVGIYSWSSSEAGIYLKPTSTGDTISGNSLGGPGVTGCDFGIEAAVGSGGNTISGNTITNVLYNYSLEGEGIDLNDSNNNTISGNTVSSSFTGISLGGNNGGKNNTISGNTISSNYYGIWLENENNDTVSGNTVNSNDTGLSVRGINYTISGNTISSNRVGLGVSLIPGDMNTEIYHNNLLNNTEQVGAQHAAGHFNLPAPIGGNYWSDWTAPDANHDGIVDYPYVLRGGQDNLPLTHQVTSGKPPLSLSLPDSFWGSLSDYQAGVLSVTWTVNNSGAAEAWNVQLTSSNNTNGVTLATSLPATIGSGDILPGASGSVTLKFNVPAGVGSWVSTLGGSAQDGVGTTYTYP